MKDFAAVHESGGGIFPRRRGGGRVCFVLSGDYAEPGPELVRRCREDRVQGTDPSNRPMAIWSLDHGHDRTGNVVMLEVGFIRGITEGKEERTMIRLVRAAAPDNLSMSGNGSAHASSACSSTSSTELGQH